MNRTEPDKQIGTPGKSFRLQKDNAKLLGVCGGIADYFGIDATIVRIAFVVTTLVGFGSPVLAYLIVALIAD